MKIYCDNCMGENEVKDSQIKMTGFRATCKICGHMIFIDEEAVKALLLRRNQIEEKLPADSLSDSTEELNSVAQSNVSTTVAAKLDLPKLETSPAIITVLDGPDIGLEFTMNTPRIVIGRRGADLNLNDRLISRRHVALEAAGGRFLLKDLGSTNGTFLNGSPVSMEFLKHGDEIQVGSTLMRFRIKSMDSDIVVIDE